MVSEFFGKAQAWQRAVQCLLQLIYVIGICVGQHPPSRTFDIPGFLGSCGRRVHGRPLILLSRFVFDNVRRRQVPRHSGH